MIPSNLDRFHAMETSSGATLVRAHESWWARGGLFFRDPSRNGNPTNARFSGQTAQRNVMERLLFTARTGLIEEDDLPDNTRTSARTIDIARQVSMSVRQVKALLEEGMIRQAYSTAF